MEQINKKEKILFVLVLYNCTIEESKSFKTLLATLPDEHKHLFVYDNSPQMQVTRVPVGCYVRDTTNSGLGKAYNTACSYAVERHYKRMMFLDQDTEFPIGALDMYQKAMIDFPDIQMIVPRHRISTGKYISPTHYFMKTSCPQKETISGIVSFRQAGPINSGILITVSSFKKAGGYDEAVWLDFSDIRFIEKYKRHYNCFYVIKDLICIQNYSAIETDIRNISKRHKIYLECAVNYPRDTLSDSIALTLTTLRKSLSQTIRNRSISFLIDYWKIYIRRKQRE